MFYFENDFPGTTFQVQRQFVTTMQKSLIDQLICSVNNLQFSNESV